MRSKFFASTVVIVLGLAVPVVSSIVFPDVVVAQTVEEKKKEADRLVREAIQQFEIKKFEKSILLWEKAITLYQEIKDYREEGNALGGLGMSYFYLKQYNKAINYLEKRLLFDRKFTNKISESMSLKRLHQAYFYLGEHSLGIQYLKQSLIIDREIKDIKEELISLAGLTDSYYWMGEFYQAIEFGEQRLIVARKFKDQTSEGNALGDLGNSYSALGDFSKAIDCDMQRLNIYIKTNDIKGISGALGNLGVNYRMLGNYSKSIMLSEESLKISRSIKDRSQEATSLLNLGHVHTIHNQYARAIFYYEKSLDIFHELQDDEKKGKALGSLGIIYNRIGNYSKAIEYTRNHLEIARRTRDKMGEGNALGSLGIIYYSQGNYVKAIEYGEQYLRISRESKNQQGEGQSLTNLGMMLRKSKNLFAAQKKLFEGVNVWESLRKKINNNDQSKISIFETQSYTYSLLQQVLIANENSVSALEISDRGRSRALVELMSARLSREPIEKQKIENLSIAQIQNVAKTQNATLVQYSIVSKEELYIYITQPNGQVSFRKVDLTKLKQPIKELVNTGREAIGIRGRGDFTANIPENILQEAQAKRDAQRDRNLRELHQLLIEPIADLLPKTETENVVFMPQGELFLVPFAALLDANNQPLITKHTILTSPSIQTLDLTHKTAQASPKGDRPSLVVGNPTMPSISTVIGDKPTQLKNLPGAETEANTIATQLNTIAITGANAKKDTVVKQMQTAGIIHLATHGLLDSFKGDTPGAIALAPNGTGDRNDGLLTSGEIFDLKLTADLVVLSACDTGRGDITGDGVIGLSRSLFVAGVPSVIVSLWKVPDESTSFLMTEFYKNWKQRNLNKAQALRQAMLTTRTKYPRPIDWAAFTLIGEAD